jgi:hypothetical protein
MITAFPRSGQFGEAHFGGCQLGDPRRTRRLVRLADQILAHPEGSLPHKLRNPADYRALCRLANRPEVTHQAIVSYHCQTTRDTCRHHPGVILHIHDTTELDFSGHTTLASLGQIGNGHGRGYECHNTLAVDPADGHLIGLAHQILHQRRRVPAGEGVAAKRAHPGRESRLWVRAVGALGPAPAGARRVDVCDRGADTFEFLDYEVRHGRAFVIRSTHSRALAVADEGTGAALLHERLRALPAQLGWTARIAAQPGQPARRARLQAAAQVVRLQPPHVRRGEHGAAALTVWALRVWEVEAPAGVEPLEWLLLTDADGPRDAAALRERVSWYERRPLIEEYHKAQKTGVTIEGLQLQSQAGLEPVLGLLSVVAVALVNLRGAARDERRAARPAAEVVEPLWVRVLSIWRYGEERALTVREFTLALGRLGGHLNRKCDGLPGWQTLWKGWTQLHAMISYELAREKMR